MDLAYAQVALAPYPLNNGPIPQRPRPRLWVPLEQLRVGTGAHLNLQEAEMRIKYTVWCSMQCVFVSVSVCLSYLFLFEIERVAMK